MWHVYVQVSGAGAATLKTPNLPQAAQPSESDLDDSRPDPHDNELYDIPDMEAMDKAGADFLRRFEKEE
jgi:hypothetical protein